MSIQHSSPSDRTGGMSPDSAGTAKISWIAWFKPKSSWSEDNSFTTAGVYLSEHRLCSFTWGASAPRFRLGGRSALPVKDHLLGLAALPLECRNTLSLLPQ